MTRLGYLVLAVCLVFSFAMGFQASSYIKPAMPEMPQMEVIGVDHPDYGEVVCMTPDTFATWVYYMNILGEAYQ